MTVEERKQRNRLAQTAFRERQTQITKELEKTAEETEKNLRNLSNTHISTAHELVMLRYQNSLLERMCYENGQYEAHLRSSLYKL